MSLDIVFSVGTAVGTLAADQYLGPDCACSAILLPDRKAPVDHH